MLQRHREEVIDRLEVARKKFLLRFLDFFFHAFDQLLHLDLLCDLAIEPVDAGHIRAVIQSQRRIVAEKRCDRDRMLVIQEQRRLIRRPRVRNDLDLRARHRRFRARLDFLERKHVRIVTKVTRLHRQGVEVHVHPQDIRQRVRATEDKRFRRKRI